MKALPMKNLFYLIILLAYCVPSQAQKIRFDDSTNVWSHYISREDASQGHITKIQYYVSRYIGDTTINGSLYRKLFTGYVSDIPNTNTVERLEGLIRYDSSTNIVYTYSDTGDQVLYDYNVSIGDTVHALYPVQGINGNPPAPIWHVVTQINTVMINGNIHKIFHYQVVDMDLYFNYFARDYDIIEGIGCTSGITFPKTGSIGILGFNERGRGLACFMNNGQQPSTIGFNLNCNETTLNTKTVINNTDRVTAFPQPANGPVTIELPKNSIDIMVYNSLGRKIYTKQLYDNKTLQLEKQPTGMYYYIITTKENKTYKGKISFL